LQNSCCGSCHLAAIAPEDGATEASRNLAIGEFQEPDEIDFAS